MSISLLGFWLWSSCPLHTPSGICQVSSGHRGHLASCFPSCHSTVRLHYGLCGFGKGLMYLTSSLEISDLFLIGSGGSHFQHPLDNSLKAAELPSSCLLLDVGYPICFNPALLSLKTCHPFIYTHIHAHTYIPSCTYTYVNTYSVHMHTHMYIYITDYFGL